jgi:hypothetical protein
MGKRFNNEDVYGARLTCRVADECNGKAWLLIDQKMWDEARAECLGDKIVSHQVFVFPLATSEHMYTLVLQLAF